MFDNVPEIINSPEIVRYLDEVENNNCIALPYMNV